MNITKRIMVVGVIAPCMTVAPTVWAQYTANFQTNIISSVTSNWSSDYRVGDLNFGDVLVLQSTGVLANFGGYVGNGVSSSNSVLVTDSGSIWSNSFLYVGVQGVGNNLVISNGGKVFDGFANIGGGASPRISSNSVVVTGTGSVWSNGSDLYIGVYQAGNRVVVNNGGLLVNGAGHIGYNAFTASNNSVVVSDSGSVWKNTGSLNVGEWGSRCSLVVSNGGVVLNGFGIVGYNSGASNDSVVVIGPGSLWTNSNDLVVGDFGARNSLAILNSGVVYNSTAYIGANASAVSNSVLVSDTGSAWQVANSLFVGAGSARNSLVIRNGGAVFSNGGTVGSGSSSSNNNVVITGLGSVWSNGADLLVGNSSGGNSLVISNGGQVIDGYGYAGGYFGGSNSVVVTGSGSVWSNRNDLYVGNFGSSNSLIISDSGRVFNKNTYVGYNSPSNNSVLVTGTGSVWSMNTLDVEFSAGPNSLVVSNGGQMTSTGGLFTKSSILVTGSGSVWSNRDLRTSWNSSLVISNGGQVINRDAYVAYVNNGDSVRVADSGVWQSGTVYVGYQGTNASLVVAGGTVFAASLTIGAYSPACDNLVQLDSGSLIVTNATHDAVLEVRNGSFIQNGGVLQADGLVMTNACGLFVRNGGTQIIGTLVLDPNLSAVGDGIPNGWKQQYGLDPLDPNLANEDADGDGMSNLQEYLAGTDPTNSASFFSITAVAQEGNDVRVTWMTGMGRTNALQATTGDITGSYSNNFADIFVVTNSIGTTTNYLDLGAATNFPSRYYRVRLVP